MTRDADINTAPKTEEGSSSGTEPRRLEQYESNLHPNSHIEEYLELLSVNCPNSTFQSHKSSLKNFGAWLLYYHDVDDGEFASLVPYVETLLPDFSADTVRGHIDTIANYLAYVWEADPTLIKTRLAKHIQRNPSTCEANNRGEVVRLLTPESPRGVTARQIEDVITLLRSRRFATRTHVIVETILDTGALPRYIRKTRKRDLDIEAGEIAVRISTRHAISKAGILTARSCSLTGPTLDALTDYLKFERPDHYSNESLPLFATDQGPVSETTFRRSLRDASTVTSTAPDNSVDRPVTPRDIWWYAVDNIDT